MQAGGSDFTAALEILASVEALLIDPGDHDPRDVSRSWVAPPDPLATAWLAAWVDDQLMSVMWQAGEWSSRQLQEQWELSERTPLQLLQLIDERIADGSDNAGLALAVQCALRPWLGEAWMRPDVMQTRKDLLERAGAGLQLHLPPPPSVPATARKAKRIRGVITLGLIGLAGILSGLAALLSWEVWRIMQVVDG